MTDDELKRQFDATRQENAAAHAETRQEFKDTVDRLSAENRQYFEVATEAFKGQVQLIAEKVIGVTEELRRETADIRQEMRTGFADTQAMIRSLHS
jgi:phage shock protein A